MMKVMTGVDEEDDHFNEVMLKLMMKVMTGDVDDNIEGIDNNVKAVDDDNNDDEGFGDDVEADDRYVMRMRMMKKSVMMMIMKIL